MMISIETYLKVINYKIKESSKFGWACFGQNALSLDSYNNECSTSIIVDTENQTVYQVEVHDYLANRSYRMINPDFMQKYFEEAKNRNVDPNQAYDDVNFVDLEVDEDMLEKLEAIVQARDYDTRVQIPLTLSKEELYDLMLIAHNKDITLNQLVEHVIRERIEP